MDECTRGSRLFNLVYNLMIMIKKWLTSVMMLCVVAGFSQNTNTNPFRQLGTEIPTPNVYRTASGAPGHEYWQQRADYTMDIELDDVNQKIYGEETITYFNQSPDVLNYLWLQLDQNVRAQDSDTYKVATNSINKKTPFSAMKREQDAADFDGGFKMDYVKSTSGQNLKYTINKTMMRIDLDTPLKPGQAYSFKIKWWYNINDRMKIGGRSGLEYFEEDDNYLYTIAQFYPRMCVYSDNEGWQNKQFLGRGEFTLTFGNYTVNITVPSDHIIGATGELQNGTKVLSSKQRARFQKARTAKEPVMIVTQDEAVIKERNKATTKKTWTFKAQNVRDFAFASSRKFLWDAMGVKIGGKTVMAMSYYPKEGNPLWEQYSTKAVAQTLKTYSKHTVDYSYPVAISVHADAIGMEYPMICFNYGRPDKDGTYSERLKYGMIGVIIHEVGHNFFPMIINSDERQWTWMDEGLNTFCQFLTEQEFDRDYPSRRGPAKNIVGYMKGDKSKISPIMTNSESIWQFGNNAYGKPATALNILRETVMGRELFDYAFKEYANRWAFKHPTPADFFRTMEDASGVDLDWFWRGWFYTNDHVDISLSDVSWYQVNTKNPDTEYANTKEMRTWTPEDVTIAANRKDVPTSGVETDPGLVDFYTARDREKPDAVDRKAYQDFIAGLSGEELAMLNSGKEFYEIKLENIGGLVMPVILEFTFADGTREEQRIPAEIWRMGTTEITKVFAFDQAVTSINLDPKLETADTDVSNNFWPHRPQPSRFELFKRSKRKVENEMQKDIRAKEMK
ncbi:MAG: hypothetical protein ACI9YL_000912 [Luteibaculaceae bacterium]